MIIVSIYLASTCQIFKNQYLDWLYRDISYIIMCFAAFSLQRHLKKLIPLLGRYKVGQLVTITFCHLFGCLWSIDHPSGGHDAVVSMRAEQVCHHYFIMTISPMVFCGACPLCHILLNFHIIRPCNILINNPFVYKGSFPA